MWATMTERSSTPTSCDVGELRAGIAGSIRSRSPPERPPIGPSAGLASRARPRTAFLKKEPAIGDGCQSREETLRSVSRFAGALCVAIHTCIRKLREPPGTCRADPRPRPLLCRRGGLLGLSARGARFGFTVRCLAIAHGDQFFLKLQAFVEGHGGLIVLRQIFYREIAACFRRRRRLSPRVHQ